MKLCLKTEFSQKQESVWYEILPLVLIGELQRSDIGNRYDRRKNEYKDIDWNRCMDENIMHLGLTSEAKEENKLLLDWMGNFRENNSKKILAMFKIGVKFKESDSLQVLEGSRYIAPMDNYRGG